MIRRNVLIVFLLVILVFPSAALAQSRPVTTSIQNGFYIGGSQQDHALQLYGTTASYTLLLPLDVYSWQVQNLSFNFKVFNGYSWYFPEDDQVYTPVVTDNLGVISMISSQIDVSITLDDKIHEYTLCYEAISYQQEISIVCNAFRVYTDDGSIYDYGYGVDFYTGDPYTTLYYLDEYFFTAESVSLYCTFNAIEYCSALVPVPGLGAIFNCNLTDMGCPDGVFYDPPDSPNSLDDYSGISVGRFPLSGSLGITDWFAEAFNSVKSSVDRAWYDAFTWVVNSILPDIKIDVTPLRVLADYLYMFGLMVSTMRAIFPIDGMKILIDLLMWGLGALWSMMLWNFVRKVATGG
jgi:hypothetical protein